MRCIDSVGELHGADFRAIGRSPAGTAEQLWVDRAGGLAPRPLRAVDEVVSGGIVGLVVAAAGWLLLVVTSMAVRRVLDARNAASWAREWEIVEPQWSSRSQ